MSEQPAAPVRWVNGTLELATTETLADKLERASCVSFTRYCDSPWDQFRQQYLTFNLTPDEQLRVVAALRSVGVG